MLQTTNKRQDYILDFIDSQKSASVSEIFQHIQKQTSNISKITINRDLKNLIELALIIRKGAGRSVIYQLSPKYSIIKFIDPEKYFKKETDERIIIERFNFNIFSNLKSLFSDNEKKSLQNLNKIYQEKLKKLGKDVIKKEFERLTIELSWKSSKIEGNTYSLLETEQLIKEVKEAKGHTKEEAIMILNHKNTLDYIKTNLNEFKKISLRKIENIHSILINNMDISKNIRKTLVRITGTKYTPLDNQFQIKETLEKTCEVVNKEKDIFSKAVILMILIAYIQPFVDGNKRTSRLSGNAILLAHGCCPLSYRSINEVEYKKAVLLFYEQNNISYFKKLFLEQFEFAVKNYF